ncbi:Zinc finger protein CONSTANS-LIKE 10 [Ancistrocladus abbreviatus]
MGYLCDFCAEQGSVVYCRSDAACLCLSCDRNVHSANALSKRHSRTLICERCNSEPAVVRCLEENLSLCQNCDWIGYGVSTCSSSHKRQCISSYSGCPSAAELSTIWPFTLDLPVPVTDDSTCEQGFGLLSIGENCIPDLLSPTTKDNILQASTAVGRNDEQTVHTSGVWMEPSSVPKLSMPQGQEQPVASEDRASSKVC